MIKEKNDDYFFQASDPQTYEEWIHEIQKLFQRDPLNNEKFKDGLIQDLIDHLMIF